MYNLIKGPFEYRPHFNGRESSLTLAPHHIILINELIGSTPTKIRGEVMLDGSPLSVRGCQCEA